MKTWLVVAIIACATATAVAESPKPTVQIKSWQQGSTQVQEQTLNVSLTRTQPKYESIIKDSSGAPRYRLSVFPSGLYAPSGSIAAWHVFLTSLNSNENLLTPSNDLLQEEFGRDDYVWWLYPGENSIIPIGATRLVQVENFYVTIAVDGVDVSPSGQLAGLKVKLTFSNTPRSI